MPDILDENGLQIKTLDELIAEKEAIYRELFGEDVILDSNSADGQLINITAQAGVDIRERIMDVYNSFDPDECIGRVQDSRYKINNIERKGGKWTIQPIDIVVNKTVTLQGLDENYGDANASSYAVKDSAGNVWYLIDTATVANNGEVARLPFRAKEIGIVQPIIGEITEQVTPITGVISVINSVAPTSLGEEEETDIEFQIRRNKSVAVNGQGNTDTIKAKILATEGVSDARVYDYDWESYPNADANGLNPHFIWAIVEGGSNQEIGEILYTNSGGAGMKGEVIVPVYSASGQVYNAKFDRPIAVPLYIKFSLQETEPNTIFDIEGIKDYIAKNLTYIIGELAETAKPTEIARAGLVSVSTSGAVINLLISTDGVDYKSYIPCPTVQSQFVVDTEKITIEEINL